MDYIVECLLQFNGMDGYQLEFWREVPNVMFLPPLGLLGRWHVVKASPSTK